MAALVSWGRGGGSFQEGTDFVSWRWSPSTEKYFPTWLGSGQPRLPGDATSCCSPSWGHCPVSVAAPACNLNIPPPPTHVPTSAQWVSPKAVSLLTDDIQGKALLVESQWPLPVPFRVPCSLEPSLCHALFSNKSHDIYDPRLPERLSHPFLYAHPTRLRGTNSYLQPLSTTLLWRVGWEVPWLFWGCVRRQRDYPPPSRLVM